MSSSSKPLANFQFPELSSNYIEFNPETFLAAITEQPKEWLSYFTNYTKRVEEFKNYYDALVVENTQLENTVTDLSDKEITWAQEKVQLETQLEAVCMQQPHHPAGSTKSK